MDQWKKKGSDLRSYINSDTFPLAVRLAESEKEIPERARRPLKDLGKKLAPCQGAAMARKYGWTVGLTAEDSGCVIASDTHGWEPLSDLEGAKAFFMRMNYARDETAAQTKVDSMSRLEPGRCKAIIYAPLEKTAFEPDVVLLYVNPAQLMRLIHGACHETGQPISCTFTGAAASCTEGVIGAYLDQTVKVIAPGNGDRVWGGVQDHEMAFAPPASMLDSLIEGLARTHERGVRYPVPSFLDYQPKVGLKIPLTDIFNSKAFED